MPTRATQRASQSSIENCKSKIENRRRNHIDRALTAIKNPQLKMKLQNMPVPLTTQMLDEYMAPVLEAARSGDLTVIKNAKIGT